MSNPTADAFAAKMKYLATQDFGGVYRPGLTAAIASGSASVDDMNQITSFIKALDLAKVAQAHEAAGISPETSPQNADLLMSIGADQSIVQRANSAVSEAHDPAASASFLGNTLKTIATYSANSGDVFFPQPDSFAPGHKAPDGSSNDSIAQKAWHGVMTGLGWLGNIPGFAYRVAKQDVIDPTYFWVKDHSPGGVDPKEVAARNLGLHATGIAERGLGYDPNSASSDLAFLWSHGESDFSDLGPAYAAHGKPLVDTAIKMFSTDTGYGSAPVQTMGPFGAIPTGDANYNAALGNYQAKLNSDLQSGAITPQAYATLTQQLSDPALQDAYKAVDAAHTSLGRDLANNYIDAEKHPDLFKYISGGADLAWSFFADPTIIGGKAYAGLKAMRYGIDAMADTSRLARVYGVADKVTGEVPTANRILDRGAIHAQKNLADFLEKNKAIREAQAAGKHAEAAALFAQNMARHPDFKPLYMEAQGWRAAMTPEEIAKAHAAGTTLSLGGDVTHEAMNPMRGGANAEERAANAAANKAAGLPAIIGAKPIETPEEWVELLGEKGGLTRWLSGASIRQPRVIPGAMGFAAEARASILGRLAYNRVISGADHNPLLAMAEHGALSEIDHATDASKIIASDAGEAYKSAFAARLAGVPVLGRTAESMVNFARGLAAKGDAINRAMTTWLPTNHMIALNSTQASADIERFVRTFGTKAQASVARYLWDSADSESARRQIGRAIVNQVVDASGITRSPVGRQYMEEWNAAFDDLANVRYGLGDADKVADVARGERRVAMNLSQMETHLVLPPFSELRRIASKASILGFDKPLGEINAKAMTGWFTKASGTYTAQAGDTLESVAKKFGYSPEELKTANPSAAFAAGEKIAIPGGKDVMAGISRMLASPTASVRYGLFNNQILSKALAVVKLGWLGTTSNMLRQFAEEYVGLRLGREASDLAEGKRLLRASGRTTALVAAAHHLIPHFLRQHIASETDLYNAIARSRLSIHFGERPLDAVDEEILANYAHHTVQPEVAELLGARQSTQAEGGVRDAVDAHTNGVQTQRVGWKKDKFTGYTEGVLRNDAGIKALAASYTSLFVDKDEPALRVLAYLMWNHAAEKPAFLAKLDENTLDRMEKLVPVGYKAGEKITPPLMDSIKDYVKHAPETGVFRQRAEFLKHDETGHPIPADDEVARDAAIERYVHSQVYNVGQHVFARKDGASLNAGLVSDLLRGKTPSELELSKIPLDDLPEHVIQPTFMPAADANTADKLGEKLTAAAASGGKVFDHLVTKPMQRLERKPLFLGNYARAYRQLQPYVKQMIDAGFKEEDAKAIADRMALGRGLQDTLKYLDNPHIASQFSAIAQNFYLFYRAQEDFARRWVGLVKERPETLRMAQMAVQGGVHSGMLYKDSDGNLTLAYPGSGAIIDAFLMAQKGLGIGPDAGMKIPVAHDLTTQLNYLNPSLMNPMGFSATPMLSIPWDVLKLAIPGHDVMKSSVDMAFNGQLGNGRKWWEQFLPTEINRIVQLQGDNNDTGSQVGGAAATTILNASLAGQLNDGADDVQRQHKIADLKTSTLTAMWARALFAFAAPGATSMPELDYKDANGNFIGNPDSDLSWRALGIKNMKDEYKAMVQSFGVDKALVVWMQLHPNLLPYTVGKTTVGASSANADPTAGATQWIFDNKDLFTGKYARVAAYFIPNAPGTFDQVGWNAMQEIGVRQHKSLEQYYLDIASKNAVSTWYAAKDKYEPMIAQMKASGQRTTEIEAEYNKVKTGIKNEYPILESYFAAHSSRQTARQQNLDNLRAMVKDPSIKLPDLAGVAQMFEVLDAYTGQMAQLKGERSNWASSERQNLNSAFEGNMKAIVQKFPGLNDMYNGVFREQEQ